MHTHTHTHTHTILMIPCCQGGRSREHTSYPLPHVASFYLHLHRLILPHNIILSSFSRLILILHVILTSPLHICSVLSHVTSHTSHITSSSPPCVTKADLIMPQHYHLHLFLLLDSTFTVSLRQVAVPSPHSPPPIPSTPHCPAFHHCARRGRCVEWLAID